MRHRICTIAFKTAMRRSIRPKSRQEDSCAENSRLCSAAARRFEAESSKFAPWFIRSNASAQEPWPMKQSDSAGASAARCYERYKSKFAQVNTPAFLAMMFDDRCSPGDRRHDSFSHLSFGPPVRCPGAKILSNRTNGLAHCQKNGWCRYDVAPSQDRELRVLLPF